MKEVLFLALLFLDLCWRFVPQPGLGWHDSTTSAPADNINATMIILKENIFFIVFIGLSF